MAEIEGVEELMVGAVGLIGEVCDHHAVYRQCHIFRCRRQLLGVVQHVITAGVDMHRRAVVRQNRACDEDRVAFGVVTHCQAAAL